MAAASTVEVAEVFAEAVALSAVVEDSAAAADSAAAHADLAVALIVAVLIQAERVPLAVRDIAEAHTAAVTGGTAAGRTEADREDTREARIEARRSPVAVALQVARCDPRMHPGPLPMDSGIRLAAHRAGIRHLPALAAREMDKRRECATLRRQ